MYVCNVRKTVCSITLACAFTQTQVTIRLSSIPDNMKVSNHNQILVIMHPASILNNDIQIRIYNTVTTNCVNPVIENRLIHLFKGCTDKCCTNRGYYHEPNSTTATPVDCDISSLTSTDFQTPHSNIHEVTTEPSTMASSTASPEASLTTWQFQTPHSMIHLTTDYDKTEESISPSTQQFQASHSIIHKVTASSPHPALLLSLLQTLTMIQYE